MSDATGAVYDRGYQPYDGERLGRSGARRTIVGDGLRRVLGLRRKARRKIMPWGLIIISMLPAIVAVGLAFFIPGEISNEIDIASQNADFFVWGGTIAMLFAALSAPELFVPDRRDGVLSMLSSRPLSADDYVLSRYAGLTFIVAGFLTIPQVILFVGQVGTDAEGLVQGIGNAAHTIPRMAAAVVVYAVAFVPIAFAIAAVSNRKAIAASIYIAVMIFTSAFAEILVRGADVPGGRFAALIAPVDSAHAVTYWIFGQSNNGSLIDAANLHPAWALGGLVVIAGASVAFVISRYRRLL
jgi:ABC-2 type transport system permease protein